LKPHQTSWKEIKSYSRQRGHPILFLSRGKTK
jgi:hypothetical protein